MTAIDGKLLHHASDSLLVKLILTIFVICAATRFITARNHRLNPQSSPIPYWLPYFGHFLHIFYDWRSFLLRHDKYAHNGCLSLHVLGRRAAVILSHDLTNVLLSAHPEDSPSLSAIHLSLLRNVFGAPSRSKMLLNEDSTGLPNFVPQIPLSTHAMVKLISSRLPDLVSFNHHVVDQFPWERSASPQAIPHPYSLDQSRQAARVSLVTLITNFVGHVLGTVIMGEIFMEQYPQLLDDLADLDAGFKYLALGLPRWLPPMSVATAYIARKRLLTVLVSIEAALDCVDRDQEPDEPWGNVVEDLSQGFKEKSRSWRERGLSINERASMDLAALWSIYAQATTLTVWMLIQIWLTSDLWAQIKSETSAFAKVSKGARIMAFSGANRIDIEEAGLRRSCPLLVTCLAECVRQYQWPQVVLRTTKNLQNAPAHGQELHVEAGTLVICGSAPQRSSSTTFQNIADGTKSEALLHAQDDAKILARTLGTDETVVSIVLPTVAGILALWEIMPSGSRSMLVPVARSDSPCAKPSSAFNITLAQAGPSD